MNNTTVPGVISITNEDKIECNAILVTLINLISSNN